MSLSLQDVITALKEDRKSFDKILNDFTQDDKESLLREIYKSRSEPFIPVSTPIIVCSTPPLMSPDYTQTILDHLTL